MRATAVEVDWDILQVDVLAAFPNATDEEEVYVKMAPGTRRIRRPEFHWQ